MAGAWNEPQSSDCAVGGAETGTAGVVVDRDGAAADTGVNCAARAFSCSMSAKTFATLTLLQSTAFLLVFGRASAAEAAAAGAGVAEIDGGAGVGAGATGGGAVTGARALLATAAAEGGGAETGGIEATGGGLAATGADAGTAGTRVGANVDGGGTAATGALGLAATTVTEGGAKEVGGITAT